MSVEIRNTCTKCIDDGVYTKIVSECLPLEERDLLINPNCNLFSQTKQCIGCDANFVLLKSSDQSVQCVNKKGCLKLVGDSDYNNCETCISNFLNYDGICVQKTTS